MSDFTAFEALEASDSEHKIAKQAATDKLAAAIYDVREQYGAHLLCAKTKEEFHDRVALCKDDMIRTVNAHLMPVTGVMRKVCKAMEREWQQRIAAPKEDEWYDEDFYADNEAYQTQTDEQREDDRLLRERGKESSRRTANRPLHEIARDVKRNWPKVNFAAQPYLDAMHELHSVDDMYYQDPASHIVNYFLANAGTWRGPEAKRIKDELKGLVSRRANRLAYSDDDLAGYKEMFDNSPVGGQHASQAEGDAEEWHPGTKKADNTGPVQSIDQTFSPSSGDLVPEGDFHGYLDSVDQNAPSLVQRDFEARRRLAWEESREGDDTCDCCGKGVANGHAYYDGDDRVCSSCHGKKESRRRVALDGTGGVPAAAPPPAPAPGSGGNMEVGNSGGGNIDMMPPGFNQPDSGIGSPDAIAGPSALTASVVKRYAQWCVDNLARPSFKTMEYYASNRPDQEYFILTSALQRHAEVPGGGASEGWFGWPGAPVNPGGSPEPQPISPTGGSGGGLFPDGMTNVKEPMDLGLMEYHARRRTAGGNKDYLAQADEAITNLLNEKAEEFQQGIQPLQQALQTIQYAQQVQQAQNPMNVMPPAGTVNVLPQGQAPQGPAPQGVDPSSGQIDPAILQQLMGQGGMDPSAMGGGGAPAPGGPPPAAAGQGALPPEIAQQMQMQARRRHAMPMTEDGYVPGDGWIPGEDFDPHDPDEMEIMEHVFAKEKMDAMERLQRENEELRRQLDPEGLGDDYENYLADRRQGLHEGAVSELGYDWPVDEDEGDYHPDPRTKEEWHGESKRGGHPKD